MTSLITTPFPYSEPQILTDEIFKMFGGSIDNTSVMQRQAGFLLAEMDVSTDLQTFLPITTVTGVYPFSARVLLDHSYIKDIFLIQLLDKDDRIYYTISGTDSSYMRVLDQDYGTLEITPTYPYCGTYPYRMRIMYSAGLGSGTSYNPNVLLALTSYATIILNEIIGFGNEAPGDAGITDFSNQEYQETRKSLINTVYGQSPKANFVHRLLARFRKRRYVGL